MAKSRILVVDDEEDLCEILQFNLEKEGFETTIAFSAEEAIQLNMANFDLILLDVMMGKMSGFELAEKIRNEMNNDIPIIFLTAKDTENDVLTGFGLGADDYIPKPFSINQLLARVKAILKRYNDNVQHSSDESLRYKGIELDTLHKRLLVEGCANDLTKKEFEIIKLLLMNQNRVFSREDILNAIWGPGVVVTERTVDVNIARLRTKLGGYGKCLKNKSGYGYFFEF